MIEVKRLIKKWDLQNTLCKKTGIVSGVFTKKMDITGKYTHFFNEKEEKDLKNNLLLMATEIINLLANQ